MPVIILLAFASTGTLQSCEGSKFAFNARYDSVMISRVEGVKASTLAFYDNLKVSNDKSFDFHAATYQLIDTTLAVLVADESQRKKNEAVIFQAKTALSFFRKFSKEHEKMKNIPPTVLESHRKYMLDIYDTWLSTERQLNK